MDVDRLEDESGGVRVGGKGARGRMVAVGAAGMDAVGGGVAEMLMPLLGYCRGAGVDARWVVIEGDADFFAVTKRIHNRLHGAAGDGGPLGAAEQAVYERVCEENAARLIELVAPGDIVLLHFVPGLVPQLRRVLAEAERRHLRVAKLEDFVHAPRRAS
mgnify:CR=1 FL=1